MATTKPDRKQETKVQSSGHFTAIYENDRFVRFNYIHNAQKNSYNLLLQQVSAAPLL
jgi:hypothetical protein